MNGTRTRIYLALILFLALAAGFWWWKAYYGVTGYVQRLNFATTGYIAFVRQDAKGTNLYVVSADGTTPAKPLTADSLSKRSPTWSPDGHSLAFAAQGKGEGGSTFQIYLLGGGDPIQATYGSIGKDKPAFSPDGRRITFLSGGAIKAMDVNGANLDQVYPPPSHGNAPSDEDSGTQDQGAPEGMKVPPIESYQWAPVGGSVVALQVIEGEAATTPGVGQWWLGGGDQSGETSQAHVPEPESLILLPSLTAKPALLPHAEANRLGYSWFPDGVRLAVSVGTRQGNHALGVWRTDEPNLTPAFLFGSRGYTVAADNPSVSPDGTRVAFEAWRLDSAENRTPLGIAVIGTDPDKALRVMAPADIGKLPLVVRGQASTPRWSPDGKRLLYEQTGANGRDIWVVNADGSHPVNLTRGQGDNFGAVWSPRH